MEIQSLINHPVQIAKQDVIHLGQEPSELGVLYRYQSYYQGSDMRLYCYSYPIIKATPKGNWIKVYGLGLKDNKKFVNKTTRKQWASLTEVKALVDFHYRKIRQIKILNSQLQNAKAAQNLAYKLMQNEPSGESNEHT